MRLGKPITSRNRNISAVSTPFNLNNPMNKFARCRTPRFNRFLSFPTRRILHTHTHTHVDTPALPPIFDRKNAVVRRIKTRGRWSARLMKKVKIRAPFPGINEPISTFSTSPGCSIHDSSRNDLLVTRGRPADARKTGFENRPEYIYISFLSRLGLLLSPNNP